MISAVPNSACAVLACFSRSHQMAYHATSRKEHMESGVILLGRQIPLLGELQRFWDQGEAMWNLAQVLCTIHKDSKAKF